METLVSCLHTLLYSLETYSGVSRPDVAVGRPYFSVGHLILPYGNQILVLAHLMLVLGDVMFVSRHLNLMFASIWASQADMLVVGYCTLAVADLMLICLIS